MVRPFISLYALKKQKQFFYKSWPESLNHEINNFFFSLQIQKINPICFARIKKVFYFHEDHMLRHLKTLFFRESIMKKKVANGNCERPAANGHWPSVNGDQWTRAKNNPTSMDPMDVPQKKILILVIQYFSEILCSFLETL